jgi:hypothetical protein
MVQRIFFTLNTLSKQPNHHFPLALTFTLICAIIPIYVSNKYAANTWLNYLLIFLSFNKTIGTLDWMLKLLILK